MKDATLKACPLCNGELGDACEVRPRVVEELIPARLHKTQYNVHRYWCTACKTRVEARVPGVLPNQRFGVCFMLYVVSLRLIGVTWEKIQTSFHDSFGIVLSKGALVAMQRTIAEALGNEYENLKAELRRAKSVHADDTSWRVDGVNHWLWVLLSKRAAVFTVEDTRSRRVIEDHLGPSFDGVVVTDFFPSFRNLPYAQQKCLVHFLREIERFEKKPDFEETWLWQRARMRVRRLVTDARHVHETVADPIERQLAHDRLVARAQALAQLPARSVENDKYAGALAKLAGQYAESLFTFLVRDEVNWENNPAERGLRPMIVNRKVSYGSRSRTGAEDLAVLHSIGYTARLRGETFLDYAGAHVTLPHERLPQR